MRATGNAGAEKNSCEPARRLPSESADHNASRHRSDLAGHWGTRRPSSPAVANILAFALAISSTFPVEKAAAQTCGTDYAIKEGETLVQIAARVYGNPGQWTTIFYANQDRLGTNVSMLVPGLALRLPCLGGTQQAQPLPQEATTPAQAAPVSSSALNVSSLLRRVEVLTADGFAPYTGRALEGGGMLTHVVNSALGLVKDEAKGRFDFGVSWVNDWSAHLNPLLLTRAFDVGFPWARPNCEAPNLDQNSQFRCQRFFFSEPLYEAITGLFVRTNSKITALKTEMMTGATLCRTAGYPIQELDQGDRNWVKDGKVTLIRPPSVDECFRLLENGTVDGVVEAELVGRASITSLGLAAKVRLLDEPIALNTYHVLVAKTHPQARTILYYVNTSLSKLRESGEYDRIVARHLGRFWDSQQATPSAAMGVAPAGRPGQPASPKRDASAPPATPAPSPIVAGPAAPPKKTEAGK